MLQKQGASEANTHASVKHASLKHALHFLRKIPSKNYVVPQTHKFCDNKQQTPTLILFVLVNVHANLSEAFTNIFKNCENLVFQNEH